MKLFIYKNDKKVEGSKQPDFRVFSMINGKFEDVGGAWWQQDKKGTWYQSLTLKENTQPEKPTEPSYEPNFENRTEEERAISNALLREEEKKAEETYQKYNDTPRDTTKS